MITDEGDAVQFRARATTAAAFQNRPVQNLRVEDLIEYTLKAEIQTTAKIEHTLVQLNPLVIKMELIVFTISSNMG